MKLALVCIEVPDDEVAEAILDGRVFQGKATKGQLAYLAVPKLEASFKAAQDRRLAILRSGGRVSPVGAVAVEEIARKLGVSVALLHQARKLHLTFQNQPALRSQWEPRILCSEDPQGLGTVLAQIASDDPYGCTAAAGVRSAPETVSASGGGLTGAMGCVQ